MLKMVSSEGSEMAHRAKILDPKPSDLSSTTKPKGEEDRTDPHSSPLTSTHEPQIPICIHTFTN